MKHGVKLLVLVMLLFTVGCSVAAAPMAASRRWQDIGVGYPTTPAYAEKMVIAALEEMGGEVAWIQRGPEKRTDVHYSVSESRTIHGTWGVKRPGKYLEAPVNFVVDINTMPTNKFNPLKPGTEECLVNIRIGMGGFGCWCCANKFHEILERKFNEPVKCD